MATKADFTEPEWEELHQGATGAAMLVSLADRSFMDTFGEASALAKYQAGAATTAPSQLIRELASVHGTGFGLTSSPVEVQARTLAALGSAIASLSAKAPDELDAYHAYVLGACDAVAEAKGGVKPAEEAAIASVRQALGLG